jgi:REP element-mobilizing transposase RayT
MPYDDLRIGRYSETNRLYFVTTVINNRNDAIFRDFFCARLVVNEMRYLHKSGKVGSIAWVIMPDHLHWLFQLKEQDSLPNVMKQLKARSAQNINQYLNKTGAVWQRAYYDHALRKEEDIKEVSRYIVANPLRAGLVSYINDYPLWDAIWL